MGNRILPILYELTFIRENLRTEGQVGLRNFLVFQNTAQAVARREGGQCRYVHANAPASYSYRDKSYSSVTGPVTDVIGSCEC